MIDFFNRIKPLCLQCDIEGLRVTPVTPSLLGCKNKIEILNRKNIYPQYNIDGLGGALNWGPPSLKQPKTDIFIQNVYYSDIHIYI